MKYPKIQSIFKRDENKKFTDEYSCPEFEYLKNNHWIGTEKIDGTNIRFIYHNGAINIKGREDKSQIPKPLMEALLPIASRIPEVFGEKDVILYGEGYGQKIQKAGKLYLPNAHNFILFDVRVNDEWWLRRGDVDSVAEELDIQSVPVIFGGTLQEAVDMVWQGFGSTLGTARAEGLVLVPEANLHNRSGNRIIT
nr:RNA ligase family protein [Candidatus Brocadiales bacterium]